MRRLRAPLPPFWEHPENLPDANSRVSWRSAHHAHHGTPSTSHVEPHVPVRDRWPLQA